MTVQELRYDFKVKYDKVDSQSKENFNPAEIDWILNRAQETLIKRRYGQNNLYRTGFEGTQKRIDDLSTLVVKYPKQPEVPVINLGDNVYELPLDNLQHPYLFFLRGKVQIVKPSCTVWARMQPVQHDDFDDALDDPFNSPSNEFIPYNFGRSSAGKSSIFLYSGGEILTKARVEYIKYPRRISGGDYVYINGVQYSEQTSELPEHMHTELVDVAVEIASSITEDPNFLQIKKMQALNAE